MAISRRRPRRPSDRRSVRTRRSLAAIAVLAAGGLALLFAQIVLAVAPSASFTGPSLLRRGSPGRSARRHHSGRRRRLDQVDHVDLRRRGVELGLERVALLRQPGLYTVTMTVTDSANEVGTATQQVLVDAPPVASFTATHRHARPAIPTWGRPCSSTSRSSDPDGSIISYSLDLRRRGHVERAEPGARLHPERQPHRPARGHRRPRRDGHRTQSFPVNAPPVAKGIAAAVNPLAGQDPLVPLVGQQVRSPPVHRRRRGRRPRPLHLGGLGRRDRGATRRTCSARPTRPPATRSSRCR